MLHFLLRVETWYFRLESRAVTVVGGGAGEAVID
jgi:hypothetical protein